MTRVRVANTGIGLSAILVSVILFAAASPSAAFYLPDTGQTKCYQAASPYAEIPCAGTGQDGEYSINPLSYTDNGDGTVTDNNTGLMWQQEDDGATYNWYKASGTYDATYNPESTDVCGMLSLAGNTDWRLPTKKELLSLVDYAVPWPGPTISPLFSNTKGSDYWSSTTDAHNPDFGWFVKFRYGLVINFQSGDYYVRCVRGGQNDQPALTDNGNGTVTDSRTGLVWQQAELEGGMQWGAALSYCRELQLAGKNDWRLPNVKELESLIDDTKWGPAIDTTKFPGAYTSYYWASTTDAYDSGYVWSVRFDYGIVYISYKYYTYYVRCVRGGDSLPVWRSGEADLGGSWKSLDWFGLYNTTYDPWIYHLQHGWLYPYDDGSGGVFFWYHDMQKFVWTTPTNYPFLYRFGGSPTWLWYLKDSVNPRLFYNYSTAGWEQLP